MTIQEIIDRLIEGNARFVADHPDGKLQDSSRRESIIGAQEPFAIILGCADSRIVPELIFDAGLGELKNRSEIINNAIDRGEVKVVPAYYNLDSGKVDF